MIIKIADTAFDMDNKDQLTDAILSAFPEATVNIYCDEDPSCPIEDFSIDFGSDVKDLTAGDKVKELIGMHQ